MLSSIQAIRSHWPNMNTWFERFTVMLPRVSFVGFAACLAFDAVGGTPQASATPAALYQSYCSVCHGEQGNGQSRARASLSPPPTDFTSAAARVNLPRERMIASVREGRPGTAMVSWRTQLSDTQIATIVDHIRSKFMNSGTQQGAASTKSVLPVVSSKPIGNSTNSAANVPTLKGDMLSGRRLYEQNCVACHGTAGDGKGPRAYFISPTPRSFVSAESRAAFTTPVLTVSIAQGKRGTEMPAWDKVLTAQEIADVAEYVFQRFITPSSNLSQPGRK